VPAPEDRRLSGSSELIIVRKKLIPRKKTCPSVTVSTLNPTSKKLAMNPELHGEMAATNYLHYENCALLVIMQRAVAISGLLCSAQWQFLGYYAARSGNFSPTFRDNLPSLTFFTLENSSDGLSRNVGIHCVISQKSADFTCAVLCCKVSLCK
jgi:hypothetical protein